LASKKWPEKECRKSLKGNNCKIVSLRPCEFSHIFFRTQRWLRGKRKIQMKNKIHKSFQAAGTSTTHRKQFLASPT